MDDVSVKQHVSHNLDIYLQRHTESTGREVNVTSEFDKEQVKSFLNNPYWMRLALSILVDADHTDTGPNDTTSIRALTTGPLTTHPQQLAPLTTRPLCIYSDNSCPRQFIP